MTSLSITATLPRTRDRLRELIPEQQTDIEPLLDTVGQASANPRVLELRLRRFYAAFNREKQGIQNARLLGIGVAIAVAIGMMMGLLRGEPLGTGIIPTVVYFLGAVAAGIGAGYYAWVSYAYSQCYTTVLCIERNDWRAPWRPTMYGATSMPRLAFMDKPSAFFGAASKSGITKGYVRLAVPYGISLATLTDLRRIFTFKPDGHGFRDTDVTKRFDINENGERAGSYVKDLNTNDLVQMLKTNMGYLMAGAFALIAFLLLMQ